MSTLPRLRRSSPRCTQHLALAALLLAALAATLPLRAQDGAGPATEEVYLSAETFLSESFGGPLPPPRVLWISAATRAAARRILGRELTGIRLRYWGEQGKTAWILDEIGKVKPITAGFVVRAGQIERVRVLVYRESHGWEVKHSFFTDRFNGAALRPEGGLSQPVDSIAGATLSVEALRRMAELALLLDAAAAGEPAAPAPRPPATPQPSVSPSP